jgi:hypothetical protein
MNELRYIPEPPTKAKDYTEAIRKAAKSVKREPLPIRTVTTLRKRKNKLHHSR